MLSIFLRITLGVLAILVVVVIINRRFIIGLWQYGGQARSGTLSVGDPAPDVELWELDGVTRRRLPEYLRDQPLVLVFGSFT